MATSISNPVTSDAFQSQLLEYMEGATQYSVKHVERHNTLPPLTGTPSRTLRIEHPGKSSDTILQTLLAIRKRRKKLTAVESERLMLVYDDAVRRTRLALLLPSICKESSAFFQRYAVQLGEDITRALDEHCAAIRAAFRLREEQKLGDVAASQELYDEELALSVRCMMQAILGNPQAQALLLSEGFRSNGDYQYSPPAEELIELLMGYRHVIMERVAESGQEEVKRNQCLDTLKHIQERRARLIVDLETQQKQKREAHREKMAEKTKELEVHVKKMEKLSAEAKLVVANIEQRVSRQTEEDDQSEVIKELEAELGVLQAQHSRQVDEQRQAEADQRKRNFRVESEVDTWIGKYDQDMIDKQDEFDSLEAAHNQEKAQLDELTVRFEKLSAQRDAILTAKRIEEENKLAAERLLHLQITAAIRIQYLWRLWRKRAALLRKGKKKKGKGSGKKGKKGKGSGKKKKK